MKPYVIYLVWLFLATLLVCAVFPVVLCHLLNITATLLIVALGVFVAMKMIMSAFK